MSPFLCSIVAISSPLKLPDKTEFLKAFNRVNVIKSRYRIAKHTLVTITDNPLVFSVF